MPIIQAVARALEILEVFDEINKEVSIKEISTKLDLNKSTVHSLLKTLKHYGYITQNEETNDYSLGWKLYERGNLLVNQIDIRSISSRHLEKLNELTGETVHLVTRMGKEAVYIDKISGHNTLVIYSRIGKRVPLHSSAVGKVLTAYLPLPKLEQLMGPYEFEKRTKNTITNYNDYLLELEIVRTQGYSMDVEENESGIVCVAMPVYDYSGEVIAAISVSTPKANFSKNKKKENLKYLTDCVSTISKELGYQKWEERV